MNLRKIAVIPAYEPDERLIHLVKEATDAGLEVLVVDDGSGAAYREIFREADRAAHVITYPVNQGKGHALKAAFHWLLQHETGEYTVVVLDADGQHTTSDALRLLTQAEEEPEAMHLGSREMLRSAPFRSRAGNGITRTVFRLSTGTKVYDTQTGMRAFSSRMLPELLKIPGERYEYEMNQLLALADCGTPIRELPIETIYIDGNERSHFRAVRDSLRIYGQILKFSGASFVSFLTDYLLFTALTLITGGSAVLFSNITARIVSASVNFTLNRKLVFRDSGPLLRSILKYILLAAGILLANSTILWILTDALGMNALFAKLMTETVLFAVNYFVQRRVVFRRKKSTGEITKGSDGIMKEFWKRRGFFVAAGALLLGFTGYAALDTFVIPRSITVVNAAENETETQQEETTESATEAAEETATESIEEKAAAVSTADSYTDENISITLKEYRENDTTIYVADVVLSDPSYLKTALAYDTYGKNVKTATSETAAANEAILAVNGDFYGARNTGYVIRDGVLYRNTSSGAEDLVIYEDGSFEIIDEDEVSAEELLSRGAKEVFSFGPGLVIDGAVAVTEDEEVGKAMASNPRTAIGIIDENHYVFVVSDGRTEESEGLSLRELAEFLQSLGVETAYNLDGGGSSTMVFQGELVNNPTTGGNTIKERSVSDIVYIGQ